MENNLQSAGILKLKESIIIIAKYEKFNIYHIFWAFFTNDRGPIITRNHPVSWLTYT